MRENIQTVRELERAIKEDLIFKQDMWPITEEKLAREYGLSRTPVREVLSKLEQEKLIVRKNKRGTVPNVLTAGEVLDIYEIRLRLEPYAASLAARRIALGRDGSIANGGEEDISYLGLLKNTNRQYEDALLSGDVSLRQKKDLAFHMGITELSGSRALADIMERFHLAAKTFLLAETNSRALPLPGKRIDPVETHSDIIEAIESGNPETAEESMRAHITHVKARFAERYKEELK